MRLLPGLTGLLVLAGSASADLTGMYFAPIDNGEPDYVTYRAYARFDSYVDQIGAYAGLEGRPLFFSTDAPAGIYNVDVHENGHFNDLPFGNGSYIDIDTWLTIGQVGGFEGFPEFSPDFLGVPGGENVQVLVDGLTDFSHEDSAVFFPGPARPVHTWGDNDVPIDVALAQFTVAAPAPGEELYMEFGAVIQWMNGDGDVFQDYHTAIVPAPGALALLGMAGLRGRRRR